MCANWMRWFASWAAGNNRLQRTVRDRVPRSGVSPQPGQAEESGTQRATAGRRVGTVSLRVCRPTPEVRDGLLSGGLIASIRRALRLRLFKPAPLNRGQLRVQTDGATFARIESESEPG
jgi:hypothetical protein